MTNLDDQLRLTPLTLFPTAYQFPLCYPPAKNIFRSARFQFFYTYNESYVQLARIKKKNSKFFLKTAEKSNFQKFSENFWKSKKSGKYPPFGQISIF